MIKWVNFPRSHKGVYIFFHFQRHLYNLSQSVCNEKVEMFLQMTAASFSLCGCTRSLVISCLIQLLCFFQIFMALGHPWLVVAKVTDLPLSICFSLPFCYLNSSSSGHLINTLVTGYRATWIMQGDLNLINFTIIPYNILLKTLGYIHNFWGPLFNLSSK